MRKVVIKSDRFPSPSGLPYSEAVLAGSTIYTAGIVAVDFKTGKFLTESDIRAQTKRILENMKTILEASGTSLDNVIKTTVFLTDWNDYAGMNEVYKQYFVADPPARSTVQVAKLLHDLRVEIEAVAVIQ